MKTSITLFCECLAAVVLAGGCQSTDWDRERQESAETSRTNLLEQTRIIMERVPGGVFDLTQCVAIARERSTALASRRLAEKLARLDRSMAFSAFLPQVQLSYTALSLSEPPAKGLNGNAIVLQDQDVDESSLQIVQPIFAPSAWLLFRSAQRGAEMATLARERSEQMLEVSVASLYYRCCAMEDAVDRSARELDAAREQLKEGEALFAAGYLSEAEITGLRAVALDRERAAHAAERGRTLARSRLLEVMDLWPLATISVRRESLTGVADSSFRLTTPGGPEEIIPAKDLIRKPAEEWMFHAWATRLDLYVQDRAIALRRNEVIRTLAMFIPNVAGFANHYTTSDSYTVNQDYWGTGLQASLSSFIGFQNIVAYRKAREEVKGAYLEREEMAMMVLLQVLESYQALEESGETLAVAREAARAAELATADAEAQYTAGFISLARVARARAECSAATANRRAAECGYAVALYAFRNVVGGNLNEVSDAGNPDRSELK